MDFIEDMKWWHWVLLSLMVGGFLGFANSQPTEPSAVHRGMDPINFEERLMRDPLVDSRNGDKYPWITHITVYPPVILKESDGDVEGELVTFSALVMPDSYSRLARIESYETFMPYPFVQMPRGGAMDDSIYPGMTIYVGQVGDTLDSVINKFMGKDPAARLAFIQANKPLRDAKSISTRVIEAGRAYFVPWKPSDNHTVADFLDAAKIKYRYAWWRTPKLNYECWIGGAFVVGGVIWPALIQMLVKGGFGTPEATKEKKKARKRVKEKPKLVAAAPVVDSGEEALRRMQQSVGASLRGEHIDEPIAPDSEPGQVPQPKTINKLGGGVLEPSASTQPEAEKHYGGEYYPVERGAGEEITEDKKIIEDSNSILALVSDLMFGSKISAEAKAAGVPCKFVKTAAELLASPGPSGRILLVDLEVSGAIDAAAAWGKAAGKPVVGFGSHVDSATIANAKQAGIGRVVPRSLFVRLLPELVREPHA